MVFRSVEERNRAVFRQLRRDRQIARFAIGFAVLAYFLTLVSLNTST